MKTLVILYADLLTEYAFKPAFDALSAFDRAILWAEKVPNASSILILRGKNQIQTPECSLPVEVYEQEKWTIAGLLQCFAEKSKNHSCIVFGWADCPFYDTEITKKLYETHQYYAAEYTFAEGYAGGISPEVISEGTAALLAELAKENQEPVHRGSIFSVIKKDINSFEIETVIAPHDIRYLRLNLTCQTRRDFMVCSRMFQLLKENPAMAISDIALSERLSPPVLKTLPAFYNIQISEKCMGTCTFCPYPNALQSAKGVLPQNSSVFMQKEIFSQLIEKIASYSDDAVVCLSLWGEALYHPNIEECMQIVLQHPRLSLLIETTGELINMDFAEKIKSMIQNLSARNDAINWIISLDAINSEMYTQLHGENYFEAAVQAYEILQQNFPNTVYPQFLRVQENESQLEQFFRTWKEKTDNVIIQKYDWFCGQLDDKKVADLRPIQRNPCWHLRRDLHILVDGSVPLCKEHVLQATCGNIFSDSLESIWEKVGEKLEEHIQCKYKGLCENCDEYYTFNF